MSKSTLATGLLIATLFLGARVFAATVWYETKPSDSITVLEASKMVRKGDQTPVFQCDKVKIDKRLNPSKVKGSKSTYHKSLTGGLDEDAVDTALADDKSLFRCRPVEKDGQKLKAVAE